MAEIFVLPGIERRDIVGGRVDPEVVLKSAIEQGINDVVIVGRHRDGSMYIGGSESDIDKVTGMLVNAVHWLNNGTYTTPSFAPDPDGAA